MPYTVYDCSAPGEVAVIRNAEAEDYGILLSTS